MTGRPCNPDSDLKGLWRTLLGTPFPACGIADETDAQDKGVKAEEAARGKAVPAGKASASSR